MPRWLEQANAARQATPAGMASPQPNTSTAITVQAIGVLAAAAKTETYPTAAPVTGSMPRAGEIAAPVVAPMTNRGVTSPPTNPAPSDSAVNATLAVGIHRDVSWPARAS